MWSILTIFGSLHIHSIHCWEVTGSLTHKACLLRLRYRDLLASAVLRAGGETLTLQWRVSRQLVTAGLNAPHQVLSWRRNDMFRLVAGTNPVQLAFPRREANLGYPVLPDRPLTTRPRATPTGIWR